MIQSLHERALHAVRVFRSSQKDLIELIQQMDRLKGYLDFNHRSLWQYCLNELKLDENEASLLIAIARKSAEVPELKFAVEAGLISMTNARRIVPILNAENKNQWLQNAQQLTKRELEKELVTHFPKLATAEKAQYVAKTRVQFQCGFDEETYQELLDVQNLVCQKRQKHADLEATIAEMIRFYKKAHDPVLKAERAKERQAKKFRKTQNIDQSHCSALITNQTQDSALITNQTQDSILITDRNVVSARSSNLGAPPQVPEPVKSKIRDYPAALEHQINLRDRNQCTHLENSGRRCTEKRWLAFHHKIPIEHGGSDTVENLQTLCWAHHQLVHSNKGVSDRRRDYELANAG